jgi:hypothetical protein
LELGSEDGDRFAGMQSAILRRADVGDFGKYNGMFSS